MTTHVQMWGHSLALRLPKRLADELGIKPDTEVEITTKEGAIVITPIRQTDPSLDELLATFKEEHQEGEFLTGAPVGREVW